MATAIELARVGERLKALGKRMDDKFDEQEDRQGERDAAFQAAMRVVVTDAVSMAVRPLDERIRKLETLKVQMLSIAGAVSFIASATVPAVWTVLEKLFS
jgi:hypothetical protein